MDFDNLMRYLEQHNDSDVFHDSMRDMLFSLGFGVSKLWYDVRLGMSRFREFSNTHELVGYVKANDIDFIFKHESFTDYQPEVARVVVSTNYDSADSFVKSSYMHGVIRSTSTLGLENKVVSSAYVGNLFNAPVKNKLSFALDNGFIVKHNGFYFLHPRFLYDLVLKNEKEKESTT